jgi:hypothetical protein
LFTRLGSFRCKQLSDVLDRISNFCSQSWVVSRDVAMTGNSDPESQGDLAFMIGWRAGFRLRVPA